jgi:hypothetical protein
MRELPLKKTAEGNRRPDPSNARTDRDGLMIVLGVTLILLFLLGGYVSIDRTEVNPVPKPRGPVKDPRPSSLNGGSFRQNENPLRRAYRLVSTPFPDGVFEQG